MYVNHSGRIIKRKRIREWVTTYEDKSGNHVTVHAFKRPTKHRVFRVSARPGRRKFKAIRVLHTDKELVFVAKKASQKKKEAELSEEELGELEELEDLDDLEEDEDTEEEVDDSDDDEDDEDSDDEDEEDEVDDEDDDEDEDDDDEEDEEEPPAKSKKSKSKSKKSTKSKKGKSRAASDGKVGTQEVAEAAGVEGRTLRMVLRKHAIQKDPDTQRYEWSSLTHPEVKKIIKLIKERGEGRKVKQESLDNLKNKKTSKTKKKASSKITKKKKKSSSDDE